MATSFLYFSSTVGTTAFEKKYNIGLHKYLSRKIITYATLIIFFLATFGMSQTSFRLYSQ